MSGTATPTPRLTNRLYDSLKFIAQILLPALGAMYYGLAQVWGLPHPDEIVGTVTIVDTFLGVVLGLSSSAYHKSDAKYDGAIVVEQDEGGVKQANMVVDGDPATLLEQKSELTFKVTNSTPLPAKPTAP